jgi:hypothetical protein
MKLHANLKVKRTLLKDCTALRRTFIILLLKMPSSFISMEPFKTQCDNKYMVTKCVVHVVIKCRLEICLPSLQQHLVHWNVVISTVRDERRRDIRYTINQSNWKQEILSSVYASRLPHRLFSNVSTGNCIIANPVFQSKRKQGIIWQYSIPILASCRKVVLR